MGNSVISSYFTHTYTHRKVPHFQLLNDSTHLKNPFLKEKIFPCINCAYDYTSILMSRMILLASKYIIRSPKKMSIISFDSIRTYFNSYNYMIAL